MRDSGQRSHPVLVSACLVGLRCRYDGKTKQNPAVLKHLSDEHLVPVPVCPEQLAGMPTPREPTRFALGDGAAVLDGSGQVLSASGACMNQVFCRGAEETLRIARLTGCKTAIMKERSPSCGLRRVHRGTSVVDGIGVTTALLLREGLSILTEEDL